MENAIQKKRRFKKYAFIKRLYKFSGMSLREIGKLPEINLTYERIRQIVRGIT
jgi:hypothetical protein